MFERIKSVIIKEFLQVFRDKRLKAIIFIAPIIQLVVFGFVVSTDVKHISTAFYDMDKSYESRALALDMSSSEYFDIKYYPVSPEEVDFLINKGYVTCAVCLDDSFSKDLKRGEPAKLQIILDGTDSNTSIIAAGYLQQLILKYGNKISIKKTGLVSPALDPRIRVWYNPDLKISNYNVPGVMAMLVMLVCLLLTAMAVVREREIGTIEQIMVTPIKPVELVLGKTLPFAAIAFFDMILVTVAGIVLFRVPMQGAFYLLVLGVAVYILSAIAIGLFISTIAKTQQQAMMATFIFFLPAILLSGFVFPIENMPKIAQYFTYLNPLRYFLVIIRGVFLKGNNFEILWPQFIGLFILGVTLLMLSSMRFKKHIE